MSAYTFNTFSYCSGLLTGLIIRWTDIVPILGGFVLGLSVKKMPEFINTNDLPLFIQNYVNYFKGIGFPDQNNYVEKDDDVTVSGNNILQRLMNKPTDKYSKN